MAFIFVLNLLAVYFWEFYHKSLLSLLNAPSMYFDQYNEIVCALNTINSRILNINHRLWDCCVAKLVWNQPPLI